MKKVFMMLAAILTICGTMTTLTSCSDSDDDYMDRFNPSSLVGTWQSVSAEGWGASIGLEDGLEYIQFKKDGSLTRVLDDEEGPYIDHGTWKVIDGELLFSITDGELAGISIVFKVLDWSKERITLSSLGLTGYLKKVPDSEINKYLKR